MDRKFRGPATAGIPFDALRHTSCAAPGGVREDGIPCLGSASAGGPDSWMSGEGAEQPLTVSRGAGGGSSALF